MAPNCVEVYLTWNLEFCLENLNPLRPLQDLPVFKKVANGFKMFENKMLNDESFELNVAISRKNSQVSTHCIIRWLKVNENTQNRQCAKGRIGPPGPGSPGRPGEGGTTYRMFLCLKSCYCGFLRGRRRNFHNGVKLILKIHTFFRISVFDGQKFLEISILISYYID